jgi:hypothetical protein
VSRLARALQATLLIAAAIFGIIASVFGPQEITRFLGALAR